MKVNSIHSSWSCERRSLGIETPSLHAVLLDLDAAEAGEQGGPA